MSRKIGFYCFTYISFYFIRRGQILLLVIHATNNTRVIYLHALRSDYLLATNLLDLSLGLRRERPIWATFVIGQQIVWGTNCKPCPFLCLFCIKWTNPVVFVLWAQTPKLSPYILAWFWRWILLSYIFYFYRAKCVCVVLDFWMHSIYRCTSRVFGIFMQKWRLDMGLCFVHVCVSEHLFPPYLFTIYTTRLAPLWAMCSTSSDIAH